MVTGNVFIFDNIDKALKYDLETEQRVLAQDPYRLKPPMVVCQIPGMFSQPFLRRLSDKHTCLLTCKTISLTAYFNISTTDKFVIAGLTKYLC